MITARSHGFEERFHMHKLWMIISFKFKMIGEFHPIATGTKHDNLPRIQMRDWNGPTDGLPKAPIANLGRQESSGPPSSVLSPFYQGLDPSQTSTNTPKCRRSGIPLAAPSTETWTRLRDSTGSCHCCNRTSTRSSDRQCRNLCSCSHKTRSRWPPNSPRSQQLRHAWECFPPEDRCGRKLLGNGVVGERFWKETEVEESKSV